MIIIVLIVACIVVIGLILACRKGMLEGMSTPPPPVVTINASKDQACDTSLIPSLQAELQGDSNLYITKLVWVNDPTCNVTVNIQPKGSATASYVIWQQPITGHDDISTIRHIVRRTLYGNGNLALVVTSAPGGSQSALNLAQALNQDSSSGNFDYIMNTYNANSGPVYISVYPNGTPGKIVAFKYSTPGLSDKVSQIENNILSMIDDLSSVRYDYKL